MEEEATMRRSVTTLLRRKKLLLAILGGCLAVVAVVCGLSQQDTYSIDLSTLKTVRETRWMLWDKTLCNDVSWAETPLSVSLAKWPASTGLGGCEPFQRRWRNLCGRDTSVRVLPGTRIWKLSWDLRIAECVESKGETSLPLVRRAVETASDESRGAQFDIEEVAEWFRE